jgi:hypothetical protein
VKLRLQALFALAVSTLCVAASAQNLDLSKFQGTDGAIALSTSADHVEPYFATKALIVAYDMGLDISEPARKWIAWLLPRQKTSGSFDRFCGKPGQWRACATADADDSMLALWIELLYVTSPDGIPAEWQTPLAWAEAGLEKLRNARLGTYYVSERNHVPLLMDNAEVYEALVIAAKAQGAPTGRSEFPAEQFRENLQKSIQRVFWMKREQWFRPSIQRSRPKFYPDAVAQIFPLLSGMPAEQTPAVTWAAWKTRFAREWLERKADPHPWGLIAVAAIKAGDVDAAACWLQRSEALRDGAEWNVLEEAALQSVTAKVPPQSRRSGVCKKLLGEP